MLVAEYSTKKNARNQIIIWDRIVMRNDPEKHVITIKNGKSKYEFWDDGKGLKGLSHLRR
jgi:signal peptidase complex subunit 3